MRNYRLIVNPRVAEELRELTGFSDGESGAHFLISPDLTDES